MKIKVYAGKNLIYTLFLAACCIYYFTYKFWDVRAMGFKYLVLAIIIIGIIADLIDLVKTRKSYFGSSYYFIIFILLEGVFLVYSIAAKDNNQQMLALYQYNFFTLILLACFFYSRRADISSIFDILRFLGCGLAILSFYEVMANAYLIPVNEWYGRLNYGGVWFTRAKVFSGSPMVYGLMMAILSLIAFDFYHKKRRLADLIIFIINMGGMFVSFSRGPYVSFAIGIFVYLFLEEKVNQKRLIKYIIGGITFIVILFLVIEIGSRSNTTLALLKVRMFSIFQWSSNSNWSSNASRLSIWINTFKTIFKAQNWLTGIGAAATGSRTISTGGFVTESGLLRRYVEFGIPIATLYYVFLFGLIKKGYRYSKKSKNNKLFLEAAVIICILVEDVTLQITEEISISFFLWLFIALLLTYKQNNKSNVTS